jgi:hypothetical protein
VVITLKHPIAVDGVLYTAHVCGRPARHVWEGWLEFVAEGVTEVLRTPRETTQPDADALIYWATGLSPVYLEGAVQRALDRLARLEIEAAEIAAAAVDAAQAAEVAGPAAVEAAETPRPPVVR